MIYPDQLKKYTGGRFFLLGEFTSQVPAIKEELNLHSLGTRYRLIAHPSISLFPILPFRFQ